MMLRASVEKTGAAYGLDGVIGDGDGGIPNGGLLIEFAEAALSGDESRLARAREAVSQTLGPVGMSDAAGVIATFNGIDRVADSTGTPLEHARIEESVAVRARLGIDQFPSAQAS